MFKFSDGGNRIAKKGTVEKAEREDLDFLNESNEAERMKAKGESVHKIEGERGREKTNLAIFINCLKHISPVFLKTAELDDEQRSEAIYSHVYNANLFALKLCEKMQISPQHNKWFVNSLERLYTENLLGSDAFEKSLDKIIEATKLIDFNQEYEEVNNSLKIEMALLSNLVKFSEYFHKFNFFQSEELIKNYAEFLHQEAKHWHEERVKGNSLLKQEEKVIYYVSLLNEVNQMFIYTWKEEANKFVARMRNMTQSELKEWQENNTIFKDLCDLCHQRMKQLFLLANIVLPNRR